MRVELLPALLADSDVPVVWYVTEFCRARALSIAARQQPAAIVLQGLEDAELSRAALRAVLRPVWERLATEVAERRSMHFALRAVLRQVFDQELLNPSEARRVREKGEPAFIRRVKDLHRLQGKNGSKSFLQQRAKEAGFNLYEILRRNTVLHAWPCLSVEARRDLADQLAFPSTEALGRFLQRVLCDLRCDAGDLCLGRLAQWLLAPLPES